MRRSTRATRQPHSAGLRSKRAAVIVALASLGSYHGALDGQTIRGRLVESGRRTPIAVGSVVLVDEDNRELARALTGSDGRFTLVAPRPGSYFIRGEALGYRTKTDGILEMGEGGELSIEFHLVPEPLEIAGVGAEAERDPIARARERRLRGQGFYDRMDRGFGEFVTPAEIERRLPLDPEDLFRDVRAVSLRPAPMDGYRLPGPAGRRLHGTLLMLGLSSSPTVYIDGTLVWPPARGATAGCQGSAPPRPGASGSGPGGELYPFPIEEHVAIADIMAVEVYSGPSETPPQYAAFAPCGLILIWTG